VTLPSSFPSLPREWAAHRGGAVSRAMISLHQEFRAGGITELLAIEEHLLRALDHRPTEREGGDSRALRIAREVIEANSQKPMRLGAVARQAGVTAPYLARLFRRRLGRTMGEYLRSLRARRAAALLASSPVALADIAVVTGFADQSHLCRVFKAEYGMSPLRYRHLAQRSNAFKT
jgi:AraC family transcriptional regulator